MLIYTPLLHIVVNICYGEYVCILKRCTVYHKLGKEPIVYSSSLLIRHKKTVVFLRKNALRHGSFLRRDREGLLRHGVWRKGGRNQGNRGGYGKKPYNRDRKPSSGGSATGGTTLKANNDFFGIFLGNSGNNSEE